MVSHEDLNWGRILLGGLLFWLPGITWTWALAPSMPWLYRVPLSIIVAFTVLPAAMFLLNLLIRVPITPAVQGALAALLALGGLMVILERHRDIVAPEP